MGGSIGGPIGGRATGDEKTASQERLDQLALETQRLMEQYKRSMELMSNIMKSMHDMAMKAINNTR
jgi:hypothetical protein